jgi:hypothetical protein
MERVNENEIGNASSTHGRKKNAYRVLVGKNQKERDH